MTPLHRTFRVRRAAVAVRVALARLCDRLDHADSSALLYLALVFSVSWANLGAAETKQPADYVNPLIDSAHSRWIFFSSACRPFGMVNLSPDTDTKGWWNSGYCYHTGSTGGRVRATAMALTCGDNRGQRFAMAPPPCRLSFRSTFFISSITHDATMTVTPLTCFAPLRPLTVLL